jgi:hypothetical protein
MDFATFVFLIGMTAAVAYVSYIIFCDVYALVSNSVEGFASNPLFLKLHAHS